MYFRFMIVNTGRLRKLIFSLTKTEKRYITVILNTHKEDNKYNLVFNSILKEIDLKTVFPKASIGVLKNDTYYFILKNLRTFSAKKSIKQSLNNSLSNIEILVDKSMYKEALKETQRAITLSEKFSEYSYLTKFISWLQYIKNANINFDLKQSEIDKSYNIMKQTISKLENINNYYKLSNYVYREYKLFYNRKDEKAKKALLTLLENPLLEHDKKPISNKALVNYYNLLTIKHQVNDNTELMLETTLKTVDLIEKDEALFIENKSLYFSVLYNSVIIAISLKKNKLAEKVLQKFTNNKKISNKKFSSRDKLYLFKSHYYLKIKLLNAQGNFQEVIDFTNNTKDNYTKLEPKIDSVYKSKIKLELSKTYLYLQKHKEAFNCLNTVVNDKNINWKKESYDISLLYIILLFELQYKSLLLSNLRSFKRIIKLSKAQNHNFKEALLVLLQYISTNSLTIIDTNKAKEIFSYFEKDKSIFKDENLFLLFWLKSKILKKSISKIILQQNSKYL